jgi:hypothetical protein
MQVNSIEPITDDNWHQAAATLCRSAMTFETLLVQCLERNADLVEDLIVPYVDDFKTCSAVVTHWRQYLEITDGLGIKKD